MWFTCKRIAEKLNSIIVLAAAIGIFIMVNLVADKLPWSYDMTATKIFTLSGQTEKIVKNLHQQVNVVAFFQEGAEDRRIKALLEEYRKIDLGKILIHFVDAEKSPEIAGRYDPGNEGIANGCIIFECGGRIKKVNQFEVETPSEYGKDFNGEPLFTGAILHVTAPRFHKIYFSEGHLELSPVTDLLKLKGRIEGETGIVANLNLLKTNPVPADADAVVVASPKRDFDPAEINALTDFLEKGGRAIFMFDVLAPGTQLPNINGLLKNYQIAVHNNFVAEEDPQSYYANRKNYLVPEYADQSIVANLKSENLDVFLPYAGNIEILSQTNPAIKTEPIIRSSQKSWIRYNVADTRADMTAADQRGPANLAVAVTKDNSALKYRETKLAVIYNARFVMDNMLDIQGNYDFIMNAVGWVEDRKEAIVVRPKILDTNMLFVRDDQKVAMMLLAIFLLPTAVFGAGFLVWLRRRHQ